MNRQQSLIAANLSPATVAARDYQDGGGQDDNPYRAGSAEHRAYEWAMHRLWAEELRADNQQAQHGGTP